MLFGKMLVRINIMGISSRSIVMVVGCFSVIVVFRSIYILRFLKYFWKNFFVSSEMGSRFLIIRRIMRGNNIMIVVTVIIRLA